MRRADDTDALTPARAGMNGWRATLAIVRRRLDRRYALDWIARFMLVAVIAFAFEPLLRGTPAVIVLTLLLPLAGVTESAQADALRRASFFALPLYGRQLARAVAVAPALGALAAPLGFLCGFAVRHMSLAPEWWIAVICANVAGALVALGAVFREGPRAWLYYALTVLCGGAVVAPMAGSPPGALVFSVSIAALSGFVALRAVGETIARYDPLPE